MTAAPDRPADPGASTEPRLPLAGVRVLDVATLGAGPWMATRLADFGADVLKIEQPAAGDPMRTLGTMADGVSLWWKVDQRNKTSMSLNLREPEGQRILKELVADADVLVENFRPGTLERWNLGWEELSQVNPRLVMLRVTGWGQDGPYKDQAGFGTLAEAFSGWAHLNGFPDQPPLLPPMGLGDSVASVLGAFAVMVALYDRDARGGSGQFIDLAIWESLFSLIGQQVAIFDRTGVVPQREGNAISLIAPRGAFQTSDGRWLALAAATPAIFARVAAAIEQPGLVDDPRFHDNTARSANRHELEAIIQGWIGARTQDEVLAAFARADAAIAPVMDAEQLTRDPHVAARDAIVEIDDPDIGPTRLAGVFPKLSATPGRIRHLGPLPGSHTDATLAGLGYSPEQVAELRAKGVV